MDKMNDNNENGPGCYFSRLFSSLGGELVLAGTAQGTLEILGEIGKLGAGGHAVLGIAGSLIVNPTAQIANVLHNKTLLLTKNMGFSKL